MRIPVDVTYDIYNKRIADPADTTQAWGGQVSMFIDNEYLIRLTVLNPPPSTALNMSSATTFRLGIGHLEEGTPLLESGKSQFNVGGDWGSASPAAGKLSIRVDTNCAPLEADLGPNAENKLYYLEVKATDAVGDSTVTFFPILIRNTVYV